MNKIQLHVTSFISALAPTSSCRHLSLQLHVTSFISALAPLS